MTPMIVASACLWTLFGFLVMLHVRFQDPFGTPPPRPALVAVAALGAPAPTLASTTGPWGELRWRPLRFEAPAEERGRWGCDEDAARCQAQSLMVSLRVGSKTDLRQVLGWWNMGLDRVGAGPLIEALQRVEEGADLDLAQLLPPRARRLLFALLPGDEADLGEAWAALHFFLEARDDQLRDDNACRERIRAQYVEIPQDAARFGDLVLHDGPDGPLRACNFVAADFVFAKGSTAWANPWKIEQLHQVIAGWNLPPGAAPKFYRRRAG